MIWGDIDIQSMSLSEEGALPSCHAQSLHLACLGCSAFVIETNTWDDQLMKTKVGLAHSFGDSLHGEIAYCSGPAVKPGIMVEVHGELGCASYLW